MYMVVTVTPAKEGSALYVTSGIGSICAPMKFLSWSIVNSAHFKCFSIESVAHMHPAPSHFPGKMSTDANGLEPFPLLDHFMRVCLIYRSSQITKI